MFEKETPDSLYHIKDLAQSSTPVDIGMGAAEITVNDGSRFPTERFLARMGEEFIVFSHRVENTLHVELRGAHGTPTSTHGAGTLVSLVVAAAHIDKIKDLLLNIQDHVWGWQPPVEGFASSPFLVTVDEGVRYIITEGVGDWSGKDGLIAEYRSGVWEFVEPDESFFVKVGGVYHTYSEGEWTEASPVAVDDLETNDPERVLAASQGVVLSQMIETTNQTIDTLEVEDIGGLIEALDLLVPKEGGKGLSANDFTDTLLDKLNQIEDEATKNETDEFLVDRTNHTGIQAIETIDGLDEELNTLYTREHNEVGGIQGGNETERFHLTSDEYQKVQSISDDLDLKVNFLDVVDDLEINDNTKVLAASQGVVLKQYIDNINTIIQSDDGSLDELQEIVDFIKANREDLNNLSINNIAGLEDALNSKVDNARVLTDVPLNAVFTDTEYDDTAIVARVEGLETAGYITADDIPEVSEAAWGGISGDITNQVDLQTALSGKQDTLISGQTIKTVNGETILGEGDIVIQSGGLDEAQLKAFLVGLEDGTLSGEEYIVMVNRDQDVVTRYSLNDLIGTIVSLVDTSGGGGDGIDFEDRLKIDSIEFGATKNEADGYLLNRANHTGTIPMSAVENLGQELANIELGGMTPSETLRVDGIEDSLALKADLDGSGKLMASQLPDIASGRKIKVANTAARLLVTTHPDLTIAYQMDDGTSWAINGGDAPSNPDNWTQLGSALISGVASFNARTGNIIPQAGDYTAEMITESDLKQFVTAEDKVSWNNRVTDAPSNGQVYGRRNGEWTIVTGGGGDLTEVNQRLSELEENKQDTLESGTSIKTVNGHTLLGSGNVATGLLAGNLVYRTSGNAFVDNVNNNVVKVAGGLKNGQVVLFGDLSDPVKIQLHSGTGTGSWEEISSINTPNVFGENPQTYLMDGNAGELSGNGNGSWVGTEQYDTGVFGQSAKFNGSSYISAPTVNTAEIQAVSMWVKLDPSSGRACYFRINGFEVGRDTQANRRVLMVSGNPNTVTPARGFAPTITTDFFHIVADKDNNCWVNGVKQGVANTVNWQIGNTAGVHIGNAYSGYSGTSHRGLIDQVRLFNRNLTDNEVMAIYAEKSDALITHNMNKPQSEVYVSFLETTNVGYPQFENNAAALNAGLRVGDLYYDSNYFIKVVF